MNNLKELKIWAKSIDLAVEVYKATGNFPIDEKFGLTSQSRRAAVSIASNIAERRWTKFFQRVCELSWYSNGSSYELQTQLVISNKLNLVCDEVLDSLLSQITELQKMNYGFQQMLKAKQGNAPNLKSNV